MSSPQKLLVVDDEAVICLACRRVFSRQGFQVDQSTNAREGLRQALDEHYDGVLLDIKMPEMDGIQFLEELREEKPDLPVLIMTGYPSIPNAAAAVRLGAADYVTKPFTPEDITQSVRRMLSRRDGNGRQTAVAIPAGAAVEPEQPEQAEAAEIEPDELLFWDEAWFRAEADGSTCVGAVLPRRAETSIAEVRLPGIGEVVYQGLPLAGLVMSDRSMVTVPAPLSGVVVAVNEAWKAGPETLAGDPCGRGWIACVAPTRLEEESARCRPRRVIVANAHVPAALAQKARLNCLGCQVRVARIWEDLEAAVREPGFGVLVFDADSFGATGPDLIVRVNRTAPSMRTVVVASTDPRREAAYRGRRIFYYAVEPFADNELVEVIDSAFRRGEEPLPPAAGRPTGQPPLSGIRITNQNRHKVELLASPGLAQASGGFGCRLKRKLAAHAFPIAVSTGEADVTPTGIVRAARLCDRVMVLTAEDIGRLPGSLARDTKAEFGSVAGETTSRVTTLRVQPSPAGPGFLGLDARTADALAGHIAEEMATY